MKLIDDAAHCKEYDNMSDDQITETGYVCCDKNIAKKISKSSMQTTERRQIAHI